MRYLLLITIFTFSAPIAAPLAVFESAAEFLASAPIATTEDFEAVPWGTGYEASAVQFDGINYQTGGQFFTCLDSEGMQSDCWRIKYGGPTTLFVDGEFVQVPSTWPAISGTNILISAGIRDNVISFGDGLSVKALGFYFTTPISPLPDEPPYPEGFTGWEFLITDTAGESHVVDAPPPTLGSDFTERPYFGFVSDARISEVLVRNKSGNVITINWGYDDVSRSSIAIPLPATLLLYMTGLIPLFARLKRHRRVGKIIAP